MDHEFTAKSSYKLEEIVLLKQNPYCMIYQGRINDQKIIIKNYREKSASLVEGEARAITTYYDIVNGKTKWMECEVVESIPEKNFIIASFVPGDNLSSYIYRSYLGTYLVTDLLDKICSLGKLLREIYLATHTTGEIDCFFSEYAHYCLRKLKSIPVWKRKFLCYNDYLPDATTNTVSFVHGDFVPANIHVNENKVGLIDFANSNYCSTIHNDIYNFKLAIQTMYISQRLKNKIIAALYQGIGDLPPDPMQEFFRVYHINRWLMLKSQSNNPLALCRILYNKNNMKQI